MYEESHMQRAMDAHKEVFKYTDEAGALRILVDGTLKFSTPNSLNDPFDISDVKIFGYDYISLEAMQLHKDALIDILFCKDKLPLFNNSSEARKVSWFRSELLKKYEKELEEARHRLLSQGKASLQDIHEWKKIDEDTKKAVQESFYSDVIFCGSTSNTNQPLWAHYAENHRGAVIKFVPNIENDSVLRLLKSVSYSDSRPSMYNSPKEFLYKALFGDLLKDLSIYMADHTHTKSTQWSYENEIRVFVPNVPSRPVFNFYHYYSNELASLYLGLRMREEIKQTIINAAVGRNPNVEIYQMAKSHQGGDYELVGKRIR